VKFIIRPRQGGKTHASVQWLLEDPENRVILCANLQMARELQRRYKLTDRQVMSAATVRTAGRGRAAEYAVEDLDTLLPYLLGTGPNPVSLVTATGESA
jgi:hypothetical protein